MYLEYRSMDSRVSESEHWAQFKCKSDSDDAGSMRLSNPSLFTGAFIVNSPNSRK